MKQTGIIVLLLAMFSCNTQTDTTVKDGADSSAAKIIKKDVISPTRDTINPKPVASFSKKVTDELNDWKFAVNIYETSDRFHFLMKMQYMELTAEDTVKIPNFGTEPKVEIKPGNERYSCIVGFLDKQNTFKPYKLVLAKNDKLSVKILQRYAVATYQGK